LSLAAFWRDGLVMVVDIREDGEGLLECAGDRCGNNGGDLTGGPCGWPSAELAEREDCGELNSSDPASIIVSRAKATGDLPAQADPYEHGLEQFFAEVLSSIHTLRAPWKRAQIDKPEWKRVANDCFARYKAKYPTFATFRLKDKRLEHPLQAADMVAYRSRRMTNQWVDNNIDGDGFQDSVEFTNALFSSVFTHFQQNKSALLEAYINGTPGYEYFRKQMVFLCQDETAHGQLASGNSGQVEE
jgi:hypothetical protein